MIYFRTDKEEIHKAIVINKHFAVYEDKSKVKVVRRKHITKVSKYLSSLCDYFEVPSLCGIWWKIRCDTFKEALTHMKKNYYDLQYLKGYIGHTQVVRGTNEEGLELL